MTYSELEEILKKKHPDILADFHIGERIQTPDSRGCFYDAGSRYQKGWYLYEYDDHAACTLCGPFDDKAIVYACALKLHISRSMQEWRFTEEDRHVYMYTHIHEQA